MISTLAGGINDPDTFNAVIKAHTRQVFYHFYSLCYKFFLHVVQLECLIAYSLISDTETSCHLLILLLAYGQGWGNIELTTGYFGLFSSLLSCFHILCIQFNSIYQTFTRIIGHCMTGCFHTTAWYGKSSWQLY